VVDLRGQQPHDHCPETRDELNALALKRGCPETRDELKGFTTAMVGARGGGGGVAGEMGRVEENAKTSGMVGSLTTIT